MTLIQTNIFVHILTQLYFFRQISFELIVFECPGFDNKFHLMARLKFWRSGECGELFYSHYDTDYADDIVLLANTPTQSRLERAASGIGLHVNADKMEYMCFNQRGDIFTQNGGSLKLVD